MILVTKITISMIVFSRATADRPPIEKRCFRKGNTYFLRGPGFLIPVKCHDFGNQDHDVYEFRFFYESGSGIAFAENLVLHKVLGMFWKGPALDFSWIA